MHPVSKKLHSSETGEFFVIIRLILIVGRLFSCYKILNIVIRQVKELSWNNAL